MHITVNAPSSHHKIKTENYVQGWFEDIYGSNTKINSGDLQKFSPALKTRQTHTEINLTHNL